MNLGEPERFRCDKISHKYQAGWSINCGFFSVVQIDAVNLKVPINPTSTWMAM